MILEHYEAVKTLIPVDEDLYDIHFGTVHGKVEGAKVTALRYPYLVLWGDLGSEHADSVSGWVNRLELAPRITYVGTGFEQCLWLAGLVRDSLRRAKPVVEGWAPSRLKQNALNPAQPDRDVRITDDVGRSTYPVYAVDEFPFTSFKLKP